MTLIHKIKAVVYFVIFCSVQPFACETETLCVVHLTITKPMNIAPYISLMLNLFLLRSSQHHSITIMNYAHKLVCINLVL